MEKVGVIRLLDTDVLVDCLRGAPSAAAWLAASSLGEFQVPGIAAMELVVGCRKRADLRTVEGFLSRFDVVWPEAPEFARAHQILSQTRFTGGLGIPDCLIAAMALTRGATICTFISRHFQAVPGLLAEEPYAR